MRPILWTGLVLAGTAAVYQFQGASIRGALIFLLALAGTSIFLIPLHRAIQLLFLYVGIEGFAKIMTSKHPIVHVGADLLVVILCARIVLSRLTTTRVSSFTWPPLTGLLFLHFFWFFIAVANPFALSLVASLAAAKMYVTMPILFLFGFGLSDHPKRIQQFIGPWILICLLQCVFSLYQASVGPSSVLGWHPGYAMELTKFEGYAFRPFGLTGQAGAPAVYLFMTAPLIFNAFLRSKSFWVKAGVSGLLAASIVTLLVCQGRAAIFKGLFGISSFFILCTVFVSGRSREIRRRLVGFGAVAVLIAALGIPFFMKKITESYGDNQRAIERSLTLFNFKNASDARHGAMDRFKQYLSEAPLGAGLSRTGAAAGKFESEIRNNHFFSHQFFTDNFWVATVVDLGLPGTLLLTLLVGSVLTLGLRSFLRTRDPLLKATSGAILCALVSISLGMYGAEAVLYNPEAAFFWFFAGVLLKIPSLDPLPVFKPVAFSLPTHQPVFPAMISVRPEAMSDQENLSS